MRYLIIFALLLGGCAGFSKADLQYQAAITAVTLADWNQTLQFKENNKVENNEILGSYPTEREINTIIPLTMAAQWATAWALPEKARWLGINVKPRRLFQVLVLIGETAAVANNYKIGISVKIK